MKREYDHEEEEIYGEVITKVLTGEINTTIDFVIECCRASDLCHFSALRSQ